MNQINHISLSEDLRHKYSLLVTTRHSSAVISFIDQEVAESVYEEMTKTQTLEVARLYKKKEPLNESKLS